MCFLFSESLRSINDEGSNLAPLTKEENMETSDMYLIFFSVLHVPFFYKHMGCYGPKWLWAELTKRLLFAPILFTITNIASLSTPMRTECLRPCQQNVYAHANRSFARF